MTPPEVAAVLGTWELVIRTPIGRQAVTLMIDQEDDALVGTATGAAETVALTDLVLDGAQLRWKQAITRPMRLDLHFAVAVDGDEMTGTSRAGRLPSSQVSGRRSAAGAAPAGPP